MSPHATGVRRADGFLLAAPISPTLLRPAVPDVLARMTLDSVGLKIGRAHV